MTSATLKNWTLAAVLMAASALSQAQGPTGATPAHPHAATPKAHAMAGHRAVAAKPKATNAAKAHAVAKRTAPHRAAMAPTKAHGHRSIATSTKSAQARHGAKAAKAQVRASHPRAHKAVKVRARQHRPAVH